MESRRSTFLIVVVDSAHPIFLLILVAFSDHNSVINNMLRLRAHFCPIPRSSPTIAPIPRAYLLDDAGAKDAYPSWYLEVSSALVLAQVAG